MRACLLLVLPACNSLIGAHDFTHTDDAAAIDAIAADGTAIDSAPTNCFGSPSGLGPFCLDMLPTNATQISTTLDTNLCADGRKMIVRNDVFCVIAAKQILVASNVRATGMYPLVLVAVDTIDVNISGKIDVGSGVPNGGGTGAGAGAGACVAPASAAGGDGVLGNTAGAGGAGGSFHGRGGIGGKGVTSVQGTSATPSATPTRITGGCTGGKGGSGLSGMPVGGLGGGAVYLVAGTSITIDGTIAAGGQGGVGGNGGAGGGGGGSGGLIGLDAPNVTVKGTLSANGGGGAGGSYSQTGGSGGDATTPATRAAGGTSNGINGDGGLGSGLGILDGGIGASSSVSADGASGGGGGAGYILAITVGAIQNQGTISPPLTAITF